MRKYIIYEADDDNTSANAGGGENTKTDTTDFSDDDFTIGDADNAGNDENNQEDNANEEETDTTETDDTAGEGTDQDDTDDGDTDTTDDNVGDDQEPTADNMYGSSDDTQTDPNSLKSKDRELFDSLSLAEQQIKIRELKNLFSELHVEIGKIIDRLNLISVDADELSLQVRRAIKVLYTMKNDISFYILNIYDQKSYIENDTMFNYFLLKLDNIKKVVKTIKNELIDDN